MLRRDGYGASTQLRGRCALGRRAGKAASERVLRGAGARQVEPWGAAAVMACLGLGRVASGARRRGAKRPGGPDPAARRPEWVLQLDAPGGDGVRRAGRAFLRRLQVDAVPCSDSVTPGHTRIFSTIDRRSVCHYVLGNDQIRGVVCLNYHRMYKSVIAKIFQ